MVLVFSFGWLTQISGSDIRDINIQYPDFSYNDYGLLVMTALYLALSFFFYSCHGLGAAMQNTGWDTSVNTRLKSIPVYYQICGVGTISAMASSNATLNDIRLKISKSR